LPLYVSVDKGEKIWITPCDNWQVLKRSTPVKSLEVDPNFYINVRPAQ